MSECSMKPRLDEGKRRTPTWVASDVDIRRV
jgi:hypothetical protein